jgi:hypothetical protein
MMADNEFVLENKSTLTWKISQSELGYGLGEMKYHGEIIEPGLPWVFCLRKINGGEKVWASADSVTRETERSLKLSGALNVNGAEVQFEVTVIIDECIPALTLQFSWRVDQQLKGWEVCLSYHQSFLHEWFCHLYPFASNNKFVALPRLTYVGVPAALLFREDRSSGILFGMALDSDYLNPETWTGDTGFYFTDQVIAPQFRFGESGFLPGVKYEIPLQIILNTHKDHATQISELVKHWIQVNAFQVEDLYIRSPEEAFRLFLEGRRSTNMWNPGIGYQLEEGDPESYFVYLGEQPLSAFFEYLVFEKTGDPVWRKRCFEQMDFVLKAQNTNPSHMHYGAFHTAFDLGKQAFDSDDRGDNVGYKPDLNAYMARYILQIWRRVLENEGIDHQNWYRAAVFAADWVLRQRNPDGGLPQVVDIETGSKSISTISGRALPAMPVIAEITGAYRFQRFADQLADYLMNVIEPRFHFTGHHPDLPPDEIEEASIWGAIEYYLDHYEKTGKEEYLARAQADAYLSLLWWCPKQLSWVKNPTQLASAEQQHFLQYSIYCYQNKKIQCLRRLFQITHDDLFFQLSERILHGIFWTQVTEGNLKGATHERISDPWLARDDYGEPADYNSLGTVYMGEQSLDTMLQLLEMDLV